MNPLPREDPFTTTCSKPYQCLDVKKAESTHKVNNLNHEVMDAIKQEGKYLDEYEELNNLKPTSEHRNFRCNTTE